MPKYLVLCGGVFSGNGKGTALASIGMLLRFRGHSVQIMKMDPYLNTSADTLSPGQHGESFLSDDGTVSDLDLGTYERFVGISTNRENIYTSGLLYKELINEHENGKFLGKTLQIIPHLVDKIQDKITNLGQKADIVCVEIGGSINDIESAPFYEALRRFKQKQRNNVLIGVLAPILRCGKELKTKPIQNCLKQLQSFGLQADLLICRSPDEQIEKGTFAKITDMTGVPEDAIFLAPNVDKIEQVPLCFHKQNLDDYVADFLDLPRKHCRIHKYREMVDNLLALEAGSNTVEIGIVGKYDIEDAYLSVKEALSHASLANNVKVNIKWIAATAIETKQDAERILKDLNGIIVPGGFDNRGVEGKILAIQYARENKIPFLGICLGLQSAVIEFARNVCEMKDANSLEFDSSTKFPVIHFVEGQEKVQGKSETMRLGSYDCCLTKDSLAYELYDKKTLIKERHRHRFEVNPAYLESYAKNGFRVSGTNPESGLVEIMELDRSVHPYFIGTQAHPEFKSLLQKSAPLFFGLVNAAIDNHKKINGQKTA